MAFIYDGLKSKGEAFKLPHAEGEGVATILTSTSSFGKSTPHLLERLRKQSFKVVTNPFGRKLTEEEVKVLLDKHRPVGLLAGVEPITRGVLEDARKYLQVISRVGVGWDNVDRDAAQVLGIKVYRTVGVLNQSVAELTIGLILAALRNILLQDKEIRAGIWKKRMGGLLQGKVLGVIGYGAIGQKVGELANAFGAKILYSDLCPKDNARATCVGKEEVLQQADIITIHANGTECIFGQHELEKCKPGVILLNTARGGLVDEKALCKALASGQVTCACLDVFENEPYTGPLTEFENVILTPHIGSYAKEARSRMEEMAVENLLKGLATEAHRPTGTF